MIFISYNDQLAINEDHFSDIIRQCSILADHRVILFPNFTNYYDFSEIQIVDEEEA